jgi:hypothetical protein
MLDRRREPRLGARDLTVLVWGIDSEGRRFSQTAGARNISQNGALLTGIMWTLRPGDLIAVQHRENRARYRVVWSRGSGTEEKTLAAVQKLENEVCPWMEELQTLTAQASQGAAAEV